MSNNQKPQIEKAAEMIKEAAEKEIQAFIDKLKDCRNELNMKLRIVHEHKFEKEADYLRDKVNTINVILYELEAVADGSQKGINSKFNF